MDIISTGLLVLYGKEVAKSLRKSFAKCLILFYHNWFAVVWDPGKIGDSLQNAE